MCDGDWTRGRILRTAEAVGISTYRWGARPPEILRWFERPLAERGIEL